MCGAAAAALHMGGFLVFGFSVIHGAQTIAGRTMHSRVPQEPLLLPLKALDLKARRRTRHLIKFVRARFSSYCFGMAGLPNEAAKLFSMAAIL